VIHGHYLQEQPFDEIAVLMGVSKGRVSQLHRQALVRLREILRAAPACDVSL
jgi:RNA polymerase sigma factor FliA